MSSNVEEPSLRVSVAILNRVLFTHPKNGTTMLVMERKGSVREDGSVHVWAQPFGGAVRILNPVALGRLIGAVRFDSERSKMEMDFRILIPPSRWDALKAYCCQALAEPANRDLESSPHRELAEEFEEALGLVLQEDQYIARPAGFVWEDQPTPSGNSRARGLPTVRLYRVFDVQIVDVALAGRLLDASAGRSDEELGMLALQDLQNGGRGFKTSVLILPLQKVMDSWLALSPQMRYTKIRVDQHELDESLLAVLGDVDVPQYKRKV
ncbi:MAG TPA: hypothetical protein VHO49_17690 [Anaerolineales bacterium]|nr:hypothetical protein [Anaerolineales bacterium]